MPESTRLGVGSRVLRVLNIPAEALLWVLSGVAFFHLLRGGTRGLIGGAAITVVVVLIWALCVAPTAPLRVGASVRAGSVMALCLLTAIALIVVGLPIGGVVLAGCAIICGMSQLALKSP